jgi:hypothetical protein
MGQTNTVDHHVIIVMGDTYMMHMHVLHICISIDICVRTVIGWTSWTITNHALTVVGVIGNHYQF